MVRLINSDSTIMQLWSPITLRHPEDEGDIFSEMSVLSKATLCNTQELVYQDLFKSITKELNFFLFFNNQNNLKEESSSKMYA
jgi:hypothetical protein